MSLIIHADDFGISESVSKCIAECIEKGWATETSLMVNMPYADEAIRLARAKGFGPKVGLHLNLSQGMPLTEEVKDFPCFCNEDGTFNKKFHHGIQSRFFLSKAETSAICKEIYAQIQKFCSYDGLMRKLDSHHHIHTDWSIYKILERPAINAGFEAMRISATLHKVGMLKEVYKRFLNRRIARCFKTTDHFDGFSKALIQVAKRDISVELMTHPVYGIDGEILDAKRPYRELMELLHVDV